MRDWGLSLGTRTMARALRTIWGQALTILLVSSTVFAVRLPFPTRRNENNPNKIGHRKIALKSFISPGKELAIGRQYVVQAGRSTKLIRDPAVADYISKVTARVLSSSDDKHQVWVKVFRSPKPAAFSLPGGYIYLSSGLLQAADNEDEIAGVIAHQIAHAAARHWAARTTKAVLLQYALLPPIYAPANASAHPQAAASGLPVRVSVCSGFSSGASLAMPARSAKPAGQDESKNQVREGLALGMPLAFLKVLREDELEADYLGLQYVYKAGYDPEAYITLLRKFASRTNSSRTPPDNFLPFPSLSERIALAEKEIRSILPNASSQPKYGAHFQLMKSLL